LIGMLASVALLLLAVLPGPASAGVVVSECGTQCSVTLTISDFAGHSQSATTSFTLGSEGEIIFTKPFSLTSLGSTATVGNIFGSTDPILGYAVSGSTGTSSGATFSFAFSLPISIAAGSKVDSHAETSYSLTALGSTATLSPFLTKVATSKDINTSTGASQSKGVDVGDLFSVTGGPKTLSSPVYTATNSFVTLSDYDLMSVVVTFNLSKNSFAGASGFVQQTVVPEPGTWALLIAGLLGVATTARRRLV
jgi:hypothetical protein